MLVVRRTDFFPSGWPHGWLCLTGARAAELCAALEARSFFAPRAEAERNPAWKQLIPYCIVAVGDRLLCVERLPAQGEARLHGMRSIGIGGHINPADGPPAGAVERALRRELAEELILPGTPPRCGAGAPRGLGLLCDDTTPVGRVHAGLVYWLQLPAGQTVAVRETRKMRGACCTPSQLRRDCGLPGRPRPGVPVAENAKLWQDRGRFESWSALLLGHDLWASPVTQSQGSERGDYERAEEPYDG